MLRRWAVREHFVSEAYLRMYLSYCLLIFTHNSSKGLVVPFGVYELLAYFWFKTMTYLAVLTHFVSRADLENYLVDYSHSAHT